METKNHCERCGRYLAPAEGVVCWLAPKKNIMTCPECKAETYKASIQRALRDFFSGQKKC